MAEQDLRIMPFDIKTSLYDKYQNHFILFDVYPMQWRK
jgi:hypothetical protein